MSDNALTKEDAPWWAKLLDRFGIPTAMLAVLLYFGYKSATWLGEHVFVPVVEGHISLLESVRDESKKQTAVLKQVNSTNGLILRSTKENNDLLQEMVDAGCVINNPEDTE